MNNFFTQIPSKLLLFGEHSVLMGSPAVTMPLWKFTARFRIPAKEYIENNKESNLQLNGFFQYLNDNASFFDGHINLGQLNQVLKKGLYFDSKIPVGYGLGSSASICVATYKVFGKTNLKEINLLKVLYSRMESYFHGKSSGIDPLAIHFNKPVLVDQSKIKCLEPTCNLIEKDIHLYLLDSGLARNASDMIETFQQEFQDQTFNDKFRDNYMPILDQIRMKVEAQEPVSMNLIKTLSGQQLIFFRKLIPDPVFRVWQKCLTTNHTCIKVLGAGGGGYFLVFSLKELKDLEGYELKEV